MSINTLSVVGPGARLKISATTRGTLVFVALACTACFDSPIQESLSLRFLPNGAAIVTSRVQLASDIQVESAAVQRRVRDTQRDLTDGVDPWSRRFATLTPAAERSTWEKRLGELRSVSRSAVLTDAEDLSRFFGDTAIQASYAIHPESGTAELVLSPGAATRATQRQRRDMEEALAHWSEQLAVYFADTRAVYVYLDEHPERARAILGTIFKDARSDGLPPAPLSTEETKAVERLAESLDGVLEVLQPREGEAYSLDEISSLVYDPFPAKLDVSFPGVPLEIEGFERKGQGRLSIRGRSLWDALRSLEGRWVAPDLVSRFAAILTQDEDFDLEAFAATPRHFAATTPEAREVRTALVSALTPARAYRAVWAIHPEQDPPKDFWSEP